MTSVTTLLRVVGLLLVTSNALARTAAAAEADTTRPATTVKGEPDTGARPMGTHQKRRLELARRRAARPAVAGEATGTTPPGAGEALSSAGPDLRLLSVNVSAGGNADGWIQPGETVTLQIAISNFGNSLATNVYGVLNLAESNPYVTIVDKTASWNNIAAHGSGTSLSPHFQISTSNKLPCGYRLDLTLEMLADGYATAIPMTLPLSRSTTIASTSYLLDLVDDPTRRANESDTVVYGADATGASSSADNMGMSVAHGDVNGDGFQDLVLAAPYGDGSGNAKDEAGEVWVIYGSATGLPPTIDTAAAPSGTTVVYGADAGDQLGVDVAAGDLNGDGRDDLILGAASADGPANGRSGAGEIWIVYGQSGGFAATIDLAAPPTFARVVHGPDIGDLLGFSVTSGDMNGDGFDDAIAGAYNGDGPGNARGNAGDVWVVYGYGATLPASTDLATPPANAAVVYGVDVGDACGYTVAAGDLNGDGFDDLIAGSISGDGAGNLKSSAGEVWVLRGQATQLPASTDLAAPPATATVLYGPDAGDILGYSVASGDVDGNGIDDLVAGAYQADGPANGRGGSGEAWLVYGQSAGAPAVIDLFSPPTGVSVIYGANSSDSLGTPNAMSAGDVNGDGYDDLLLGAPLGNGYPTQVRGSSGEVWIIFGRGQALPGSIDLALPSGDALAVYGADAGDQLRAGTAGDLNGDGLDEMILGAALADAAGNLKLDAGEVHVVNGFATSTYWNRAEAFSFIDATAGGTNLQLTCDDCSVAVPIGFVFPFYGEKFSTLYVSSNGFVSFAPINDLASAAPRCIDGKGPAATSSLPLLVCPFWDDLDLRSSGAVWAKLDGTAPDRRLTIEWLNVPHYPNTGAATFEVSLYESTGQILYQYQDTTFGSASYDSGAAAVAGVQNRTGAEGTPYNCPSLQQTSLASPLAVSYNPSTPLWKDNMEGFDTSATPTKPGKWTFSAGALWKSSFNGCFYSHSMNGQLMDANFCTYSNNMVADVATTPAISSFPADGRFAFWQRFLSEPVNDVGTVQAVAAGGPTNTVLTQSGNLGANYGYPTPYFLGAPYGNKSVTFTFSFTSNASIVDWGWFVDDVRVVGCNAVGITSLVDPKAYAATTVYCGDGVNTGKLDAIGSRCGDGSDPTGYQWLENGVPIAGATSVTYTIPASHTAGTFDFAVTVTCAAGSSTSGPQRVTIVAPPASVGNTLLVTKQSAGANARFNWTDVAGASDYVVFEDPLPSGAFTTQTGTAGSGVTGLAIPMPTGNLICYKVAGRNPTCGVGPK